MVRRHLGILQHDQQPGRGEESHQDQYRRSTLLWTETEGNLYWIQDEIYDPKRWEQSTKFVEECEVYIVAVLQSVWHIYRFQGRFTDLDNVSVENKCNKNVYGNFNNKFEGPNFVFNLRKFGEAGFILIREKGNTSKISNRGRKES